MTEQSETNKQKFMEAIHRLYISICTSCKKDILDPDKNPTSLFYSGVCPKCGHNSIVCKKSKRERKREARRLRQLQREANNTYCLPP